VTGLEPFRRRLDVVDDQLLRLIGERFQICREIAEHKRRNAIPMMQSARVAEVRNRYLTAGERSGLPRSFTLDLIELLIAATCAMEDELIAAGAPSETDERRR
jgi:4-amino-4-deoxychorismate mutase